MKRISVLFLCTPVLLFSCGQNLRAPLDPLVLVAQVGQSATANLTLPNPSRTTSYSLSSPDWITVTPTSGTLIPGTSTTLTATARCGNTAGTTQGTIQLSTAPTLFDAHLPVVLVCTPGALQASPETLNFTRVVPESAQVVTVSRAGIVSHVTAGSTCSGIVSITPSMAETPQATFTVTPIKSGSCQLAFETDGQKVYTNVNVTTTNVTIDSKGFQ